jgi:hypothetical protein
MGFDALSSGLEQEPYDCDRDSVGSLARKSLGMILNRASNGAPSYIEHMADRAGNEAA